MEGTDNDVADILRAEVENGAKELIAQLRMQRQSLKADDMGAYLANLERAAKILKNIGRTVPEKQTTFSKGKQRKAPPGISDEDFESGYRQLNGARLSAYRKLQIGNPFE